ncbi:lasso RiPP family leader peptide-containing protein [Streptomyces sp. P38-E01]|uniref:Lasso RiPP family leader peptide-containing protein n=1 Tax=Streptomyces tardus TaxID=2780544 RepID=A0A949JUN1_9ACTN|nr:keywimysin-related RiPP [Streptomyces tardus]MBU7600430.1 lasso RiPP family leader peptide-containing protein [Streptomyces tardus]
MAKVYARPTLRKAGSFKKDTGFAGYFKNDAVGPWRLWRK